MLTLPLLSFFYFGSSPTLLLSVMAMFVVNVAAFCGFHLFAFPVESAMPADAMQGLGLVSTTAAAIHVAMIAFSYAKVPAGTGALAEEMPTPRAAPRARLPVRRRGGRGRGGQWGSCRRPRPGPLGEGRLKSGDRRSGPVRSRCGRGST